MRCARCARWLGRVGGVAVLKTQHQQLVFSKTLFVLVSILSSRPGCTTCHVDVALLASRARQVPVLDHVLDLAPHGERKECDKVDEEDGPKDGDVEEVEEGHREGNDDCNHCLAPVYGGG